MKPLVVMLAKKARSGTKSKATTIAGVGGILASVAMIIQGVWGGEQVDGETLVTGIGLLSAGLAAVFARDADVSSEDSTGD